RIADVSKVLTGVAVLHLVDEGLLRLDQKWLEILPEYVSPNNGDARIQDITVRHLLQHSGGWNPLRSGDPYDHLDQIASETGNSPALCSDIIDVLIKRPLDFSPGQAFRYSDFGYCILGRIVERVTGQSYEHYVRDHVLAAMDVNGMSIGYSHANQRGPYEVKYYPFGGEAPVASVFPGEGNVPSPYARELLASDAANGWVGSTIDITRVLTSIEGTRGERILSTTSMNELIADPSLEGWNTPDYWYGLGITIGPTPQTWYHEGSVAGSVSFVYRSPNHYVVAILTNSRPANLQTFIPSLRATAETIASGLKGSGSDLYPAFVSPAVPPRTK
ncbi:MAG: serine hydrolase domain-containing protein, partial [Povalibacter sp.]